MNNIALYESTGTKEAIKWAERAANTLIASGAQCYAAPELLDKFEPGFRNLIKICTYDEYEKYADAMISFGGDGTILGAARVLINTNIPIMGVNVGKLGFLAEYSVDTLDKSIADLLDGKFRIVDRTMLETTIDSEIIYALNDFVIEKKDTSSMITCDSFANGSFIGSFRADGIVITTPTGSTAYSLSCGGPIIAPSAEVICITPISPHSLTIRPIVVPDNNEIEMTISSRTGEAHFVSDGQEKRVLKTGDTIKIIKSEARVRLIKPTDSSYYDLLRHKLLWGVNMYKSDIDE
jgi:NAD+ kinase